MKRMIKADDNIQDFEGYNSDLSDMQNEFLKAAEAGSAYDFVAQNYWKMDKTELKDILLEALYLVPDSDNDDLVEGIRDRWE